ncbi:MAG: flagellar hook-length control protein FliK [Bacillota bacterium]|nr:flagellar hook-length control protein FliK [Bacillota bacterium]
MENITCPASPPGIAPAPGAPAGRATACAGAGPADVLGLSFACLLLGCLMGGAGETPTPAPAQASDVVRQAGRVLPVPGEQSQSGQLDPDGAAPASPTLQSPAGAVAGTAIVTQGTEEVSTQPVPRHTAAVRSARYATELEGQVKDSSGPDRFSGGTPSDGLLDHWPRGTPAQDLPGGLEDRADPEKTIPVSATRTAAAVKADRGEATAAQSAAQALPPTSSPETVLAPREGHGGPATSGTAAARAARMSEPGNASSHPEIRMVLEPENLGSVWLRLVSAPKGLVASFRVNTQGALGALRQGFGGLTQDLARTGVAVEHMSVGLSLSWAGGQTGQDSDSGGRAFTPGHQHACGPERSRDSPSEHSVSLLPGASRILDTIA